MKNYKPLIVIVAVVIIIILLVVIVNGSVNKNKENANNTTTPQNNTVEEFVAVQSDGTKVNTSEKLKETKTLEGLEISNIRLTESGNVSLILADVKNTTDKEAGGFTVTLKIVDKENNELASIAGYIDKVQAGETVTLNTSATADFANAYDFTIEKNQ